MAQINLLKQKTVGENFWDFFPGILAKIMILVFLVAIGFYAWLYFEAKNVEKIILNTQSEIVQKKSTLGNVMERDELLTRQSQIEELKKLVNSHKYWSQLMPILAKSTLKTATYSSLVLTPDGNLNLTVTVPDIKSLDKFLLVFDKKKVYENFSYVKIGGIRETKNQNQEKGVISVDVKLKFNTNLLKYKKSEDEK